MGKAHVSVSNVGAPVREASIAAVVIRCGCPPGEMDHAGSVCYRPRASENLGTISYYHKNPLRRLAWAAKRAFLEGRNG